MSHYEIRRAFRVMEANNGAPVGGGIPAPIAPSGGNDGGIPAPREVSADPGAPAMPGGTGEPFNADAEFDSAFAQLDADHGFFNGETKPQPSVPEPVAPSEPDAAQNVAPPDPAASADPAAAADPAAVPASEPAPLPAEAISALLAAAQALDITETDPTKIPAAIEARKTEIAAERTLAGEQAELQFEQKAIEGLQRRATDEVTALMNGAIKARMLEEDLPVNVDNWWDPKSWSENGEVIAKQLSDRYKQIWGELRAQPEYEQAYLNAFNGHKTAYDTEKARISQFPDKYPYHSASLVSTMRQAGVSADGLERFARMTHEGVVQALATSDSAIQSERRELGELRTKLSGYDAAIAQARAEGLAEGRNAALQTLQAGQLVPATVGLGGQAAPAFAFDPNRDVTYDDIPWASN